MNPDKFKRFNVPLSVLKDGIHTFDFSVDDLFFEEMESDEVYRGEVHINLKIDKQDRMFVLEFFTTGYMWVTCDRCDEEFKLELNAVDRLIIKYGDAYKEEDDDVIVIPEHQHHFNVSRHIYEYIVLSLPIRKVHPEDEAGNSLCNQETIDKLNSLSEKKEIDPRWEQLRNLLNQNNNKKV